MVDAEGLLKAQDTFFIIFKEKSLIRYILNYMKAFGTYLRHSNLCGFQYEGNIHIEKGCFLKTHIWRSIL